MYKKRRAASTFISSCTFVQVNGTDRFDVTYLHRLALNSHEYWQSWAAAASLDWHGNDGCHRELRCEEMKSREKRTKCSWKKQARARNLRQELLKRALGTPLLPFPFAPAVRHLLHGRSNHHSRRCISHSFLRPLETRSLPSASTTEARSTRNPCEMAGTTALMQSHATIFAWRLMVTQPCRIEAARCRRSKSDV